MRLVLFDCDGTLADSFDVIALTMRRAFAAAGLAEPEPVAVHGIIGLSLGEAIARLAPTVPPEAVPALVEGYKAEFLRLRSEGGVHERLFPGAEPMLRRLAARPDLVLGMVTGKSRRGVRAVIETHGLDGVFLAVRTADDCPSKPHPAMVLECCAETGIDPADTIVVGDAVFDMQMARAAGAPALGVSWGAMAEPALRAAGAGAVAHDMAALEAMLDAFAAVPASPLASVL